MTIGPVSRILDDHHAAELDAWLTALEESPERTTLVIPISPQVVRWLLRGTFVQSDGRRARVVGVGIHENQLTPTFREELTT